MQCHILSVCNWSIEVDKYFMHCHTFKDLLQEFFVSVWSLWRGQMQQFSCTSLQFWESTLWLGIVESGGVGELGGGELHLITTGSIFNITMSCSCCCQENFPTGAIKLKKKKKKVTFMCCRYVEIGQGCHQVQKVKEQTSVFYPFEVAPHSARKVPPGLDMHVIFFFLFFHLALFSIYFSSDTVFHLSEIQ